MGKTSKIGSVTAASVKKHTKKDWDEWIEVLGKCVGRSWSHQEIVALLKTKFRLSVWWQQEVARGYQIATGVREPHQTLKGTYTTTITKTLSLSAKSIFSFLISPEGQAIWLDPMSPTKLEEGRPFECNSGTFGEVRAVRANQKLRFFWFNENWPRKTVVQIQLHPKPKGRCLIAVDHSDLPTMKAKEEMHAYWRRAVDSMAESLAK
jgi:hypothetical protein